MTSSLLEINLSLTSIEESDSVNKSSVFYRVRFIVFIEESVMDDMEWFLYAIKMVLLASFLFLS